MLQKAKANVAAKPAAPPVKSEAPKILTRKEREAARLEAKSAGKGKKPLVGTSARATDTKTGATGAAPEKRKPADLGYQGTARPAKKPVEIAYKGTARAAPAATPTARPGAAAAIKKKPQAPKGRYDGYADWSDLDDEDLEDEEEDGYGSDASSDMEGGIWDVEREEAEALKAARQEDAAALAEENRLKREKDERKKKLAAMNKAAAAKRKY